MREGLSGEQRLTDESKVSAERQAQGLVEHQSAPDIDPLKVVEIARIAGKAIMEVYSGDFAVDIKEDNSPLTIADLKSNEIILAGLRSLDASIPILSEESRQESYEIRKNWEYLWLVDPLDGTKEFVGRTDEFTVNIALIHRNKPVLGVIFAPALDAMYFSKAGVGAYKMVDGQHKQLFKESNGAKDTITIVGSRSHHSDAMTAFLKEKQEQYTKVDFVKAGSALKFCLVAEGRADIYPRLAPTCEWDTGAAHAIAVEAGRQVHCYETGEELVYNKENLLNPWFICF